MAADRLPKLVVLKSVSSGCYVKYMNEDDKVRGRVYSKAESVFNPFAKIEVEREKNGSIYVRLRFFHSNKYWSRGDPAEGLAVGHDWLNATSDQPQKDTLEVSSTLFEPYSGDNGTLFFRHVQSGKRVGTFSDPKDPTNNNRLFLYPDIVGSDTAYGFTFVDADTLVPLPKWVSFKGDNGKYLNAFTTVDGWPHVQLGSEDAGNEKVPQEVELYHDGHVRIKSDFFGKLWRCNIENWILVNTKDQSPIKETLFWPVKVDDSTIALRAAQNNQFCRRLWIIESRKDCLSATAPAINQLTKLVVEELVLERCIYNVKYRMEDALVFDVEPVVVGFGAIFNEKETENTKTIYVQYEPVHSYSFKNSLFPTRGVKTTFKGALPVIKDGSIEIGSEVSAGFKLEWGREVEEMKSGQTKLEVKIPPRTRARVDYVATRCKCSVPFSYTQRDVRSTDGQVITSEHNDGVFTRVDYYNFRLEGFAFEPYHT